MGPEFKLDPQLGFELLTGTLRNILVFIPTKFEIELFRLGTDPHDVSRFARRRTLPLQDLQIDAVIPTAEDVIIQKIRWQRDKDLSDVRVVLAVQAGTLDWQYIRYWTEQHGTTSLL